ncbi:unnamed protein product, partial [Staurois parvus]
RYFRPQLSITRSRPVITCRHPVIEEHCRRRERELYVNNRDLSLSAPAHCFAWLCIAEPVESTHTTHSKTAHSAQLTL